MGVVFAGWLGGEGEGAEEGPFFVGEGALGAPGRVEADLAEPRDPASMEIDFCIVSSCFWIPERSVGGGEFARVLLARIRSISTEEDCLHGL